MQVFRHLDIGSAKVEREACQKVPHHLIDVVDIGEMFNAINYYQLADQALQVSPAVKPVRRVSLWYEQSERREGQSGAKLIISLQPLTKFTTED